MECRFLSGQRYAWILALVIMCAPAWAQQGSKPPAASPDRVGAGAANAGEQAVISVDNQKMTAADVEKFLASLPPQYRTFYSGSGRRYLPVYLVRMIVLLDKARQENLQDLPEVKAAIQIASNSILSDAAQRRLENKLDVTDQDIQALYDKEKPQLEEVRLRRIVIRTTNSLLEAAQESGRPVTPEEEARKKLEDIRKKIAGGADFAELAKENSDDVTTANQGGETGYVTDQQLVPPEAKAADGLDAGQVSQIFSTPYGLELIKVEERRPKPLAEVRTKLEAEIRQAKTNEMIQKLIAEHKVVIDKNYFAPGPSPGSKSSLAQP